MAPTLSRMAAARAAERSTIVKEKRKLLEELRLKKPAYLGKGDPGYVPNPNPKSKAKAGKGGKDDAAQAAASSSA